MQSDLPVDRDQLGSAKGSSASPFKLRVAAATARRFINERTPAQEKEYHYTYNGNYELSQEEQEAFLTTPLKPSNISKLTNSGKIRNNMYDESTSVHSSGGSNASNISPMRSSSRDREDDTWLQDGVYLQGNESDNEDSIISEKENYTMQPNVTTRTHGNANSNKRTSGKPISRDNVQSKRNDNAFRNVGTGNKITLSTSEIVSTLADAIRSSEQNRNSYSNDNNDKVIKQSKSKSPIQTLVFQKQYRDAVIISDWLTKQYSLEIIPSYILKGIDIDPSSIEDAIQYGKLMYESLASLHDGVLLCKLVNKINKSGENIPGTTYTPKTRAHKLQNIRKALNLLVVKNKQLSSSWFLIQEGEIISGNCTTILEILSKIKSEFHVRKTKKVNA